MKAHLGHTSNNHVSVLMSHNVQHLNKLLYSVMVDTYTERMSPQGGQFKVQERTMNTN